MTQKKNSTRGEGHRERLRQRFLDGGVERFSDEDIIEFLLTLGTPRVDTRLPAREALEKFRSISNVISAPIQELLKIKGIGEKNALYLKFVHDVASRYLKDRIINETCSNFNSSKNVFDYLFHSMRDLEREVFRILYLNQKNVLIKDEDLFAGDLTSSAVYPREIMKNAIKNNAASLIVVHNHPSGDPTPSSHDCSLTRNIVWASRLIGIRVLDHIIIGNNIYYSFADENHIRKFEDEYSIKLEEKFSSSLTSIK